MKISVILSAVYITLFSITSIAQSNSTGQNNVWHIGSYYETPTYSKSCYKLDFTSGTPQISEGDLKLGYYESVSVVSDQYGNERMYTDGLKVLDGSGQLMKGAPQQLLGPADGSIGTATQGALSVTDRRYNDIIHLFTTQGIDGAQNGLRYHKIDLSLSGNGTTENPLGEVVISDSLLFNNSSEMLTSIGSCESDSVWIIGHQQNSYNFIKILLSTEGLSVDTQELATPLMNGLGFKTSYGRGSLDFSPDGSKLAMTGSSFVGTHIMDFNFETGELSNPKELRYLSSSITSFTAFNGYDIEFSPDGSKLYATKISSNEMVQFDLEQDTSYTFSEISSAASLEKGPDGNIYVAKVSQNMSLSLGRISNPNNSLNADSDMAFYEAEAITFPSEVSGAVTYSLPQDNICYNNTITSAKVAQNLNPVDLYPNPATNYVFNTSGKELVFYNTLGSEIFRSTETKVNVSNLVEGIYFVMSSGNVTRLVVRK
jgi:hypothetical protein